MDNPRHILSQVTLILVGVGVILAFCFGLTSIANSIEHMPVVTSVAEPTVVPLSNDRFAVVERADDTIRVFAVDASGHVHQTDSVTYMNSEPRDLSERTKVIPRQKLMPGQE